MFLFVLYILSRYTNGCWKVLGPTHSTKSDKIRILIKKNYIVSWTLRYPFVFICYFLNQIPFDSFAFCAFSFALYFLLFLLLFNLFSFPFLIFFCYFSVLKSFSFFCFHFFLFSSRYFFFRLLLLVFILFLCSFTFLHSHNQNFRTLIWHTTVRVFVDQWTLSMSYNGNMSYQ